MSEELGCSQVLGNGTAVNGNERFVSPFAELMDAVGNIFFSCSAGSVNQDRHLGRSNQIDVIVKLAGCFALSFQKILCGKVFLAFLGCSNNLAFL